MVDAVRSDVFAPPESYEEYTDEQLRELFIDNMSQQPKFVEQKACVFANRMEAVMGGLYDRLGYKSVEEYIEQVIQRPQEWVDAALRISYRDAKEGRSRKMGEIDAEAIQAARENPQPTHADAGAQGGRGNKASDNITGFRGTSQDYTLRRLARDRPDLLDRIESGELTPNAAAVEAGFRKRKIQVEPEPQAVQRMLDRHRPGWRLFNEETGEVAERNEKGRQG